MRHYSTDYILKPTALVASFSIFLTLSPTVKADCGTIPFNVSQPMVERVVLDREALKQMFPQGGEGMTSWATIVGSSSRAAMPSLAWILKVGNNNQKTAMIMGLARAAKQCEARSRLTSRLIEQTVRDVGNASLSNQFTRLYRGQDSVSSTGLASTPGQVQPNGGSSEALSSLLSERKLRNGLSLSLDREGRSVPSIRKVESYEKIQ